MYIREIDNIYNFIYEINYLLKTYKKIEKVGFILDENFCCVNIDTVPTLNHLIRKIDNFDKNPKYYIMQTYCIHSKHDELFNFYDWFKYL